MQSQGPYKMVGRVGVEPTTLKKNGFTVRRVCRFATYPYGDPTENRTPVQRMKISCPRPLDDGTIKQDSTFTCSVAMLSTVIAGREEYPRPSCGPGSYDQPLRCFQGIYYRLKPFKFSLSTDPFNYVRNFQRFAGNVVSVKK